MTTDDAIREAAVEALTLIPGTDVLYPHSVALTVIGAVRPLIEAALREQLATAIERLYDRDDPETMSHDGFVFTQGWNNAIPHAARIVRETP